MISDSPFVLTKLEVTAFSGEDSLEVCWGLVKPKYSTSHIKSLIDCSFYIPPYSKKKSVLIQQISLNYYILKTQYPDSAFICGGDKNDLNIQLLLDINPSFRQLVTQPTYRRTDHKIAFAKTIPCSNQPVQGVPATHTIRPLTDAAISRFASWIQHEPWTFVYNGRDTSDMVERFNFLIQLNLDTHFPTKTVKTTNLDGKISSMAVKQASRRKNREYAKHGNSAKYKELKKEVKAKLSDATASFLNKQAEHVTVKDNGWLKHVKHLTARPGDQPTSTFSLPQHVEDNLSALESSNRICEYFSSIS